MKGPRPTWSLTGTTGGLTSPLRCQFAPLRTLASAAALCAKPGPPVTKARYVRARATKGQNYRLVVRRPAPRRTARTSRSPSMRRAP